MKNDKKRLISLVAVWVMFMAFSSCQKEEEAPLQQVSLSLPTSVNLRYGEEADIVLPESLVNQSDVTFELAFTETENVQITNQVRLHDKLEAAISVDREEGHIHIHTLGLYPNEAVSAVSQVKIPVAYKVTLIASTSRGEIGRQTVDIQVTPATVQVKGLDATQQIPFAYVLYSDQGASFELEASDLDLTATQWSLPGQTDAAISLSGNKVLFSAQAGDPKREEERTFDLAPALQKDGFAIATTNFRVIFIPQIDFFFGTYYPEYNLTILQNFLHIALSNGYLSSAPTLYPERYKSKFSLVSIEKDGQAFNDELSIFSVNEQTGAVTVKPNTELKAGQYKISVKALTTTGLEFVTTLTLAMEAGE